MKRAFFIALALVLAVAAGTQAQTPPARSARQATGVGPNFVDANGDGICDNYQAGNRAGSRAGRMRGHGGFGPGDGTGNKGVGPKDGTGYGAGNGTGVCDGTGPKGAARRGGRGPGR
ncbi:MAG: hypothetical protein ACE148_10180 [Vicinamibacterales bacterium]